MNYTNQQLVCVTCDRWADKRVINKKLGIVKSATMTSGICHGGVNNNFNTNPGSGSGCKTHIRWVLLQMIPIKAS
jgi:hypothetical protein